jgi:hypothetical protein
MTSLIIGGFIIPLLILIIFLWLTKRALEFKQNEFGENRVFNANTSKHVSMSQRKTSILSDSSSIKMKSKREIEECEPSITIKRTKASCDFQKSKMVLFKKRQFRVLKTILLNICFFCIAWLPYAIMVTYSQYGSNIEDYINPYTSSLPALFSKLSSIYNPFIYTLNNPECRNYFKRVFLK